MKKFFLIIFSAILLFNTVTEAKEKKMILELDYGNVEITLYPDIAPQHVKRIETLVKNKEYDGVVFHRVIEGFMAQTGDVQFGNSKKNSYDLNQVGTGSSNLPDLKAEFNNTPHERGTLSMARSADPNSGNSQFFICFQAAPHLDRQYTVFGRVTKGMEFIDKIKKGSGSNGMVENPDKIIRISLTK
tara:strand:+ start:142 stop:702 length:561 start_codon:yes stop_codon:yes gene_type:complete